MIPLVGPQFRRILDARQEGRLQGGRHIRVTDDTPLTNLQLTLLDKLGVVTEKLGDSSGMLTHLSDV